MTVMVDTVSFACAQSRLVAVPPLQHTRPHQAARVAQLHSAPNVAEAQQH